MLTRKPEGLKLKNLQRGKNRYFGSKGEDIAVDYLMSHSYKILKRNFNTRFGEIDIIALKSGTLIFCEVKTRWSDKFGAPEEAVNLWKLKRIRKAAEYFSFLHPDLPKKLAIEVVAIDIQGQSAPSIRLIRVDNI